MRLSELCYLLNEIGKFYDLKDPEVFIRIGESHLPLLDIKVIYEKDDFFESVILQDKCYQDVLM